MHRSSMAMGGLTQRVSMMPRPAVLELCRALFMYSKHGVSDLETVRRGEITRSYRRHICSLRSEPVQPGPPLTVES